MARTFDDLCVVVPATPRVRQPIRCGCSPRFCAYKLRELREALALTQTDVAHTLAISRSRISEIGGGNLDFTEVDTLRRSAEALGGTLRIEVQVGDKTFRIA